MGADADQRFGPTGILADGQADGAVTGTLDVSAGRPLPGVARRLSSRKVIVAVGGHGSGSISHQIGAEGQYTQVGTVQLGAGAQPVRSPGRPATLTPGDLLGGDAIGPLVLVANPRLPAVQTVAPAHAQLAVRAAAAMGRGGALRAGS